MPVKFKVVSITHSAKIGTTTTIEIESARLRTYV